MKLKVQHGHTVHHNRIDTTVDEHVLENATGGFVFVAAVVLATAALTMTEACNEAQKD